MTIEQRVRTGFSQSSVLPRTACARSSEESCGSHTAQQKLSSTEVADRIGVRVAAQLAGRHQGLRILVRQDGLVLLGRVRSYHAKQLAQEAVLKLSDTRIAENAIEVL